MNIDALILQCSSRMQLEFGAVCLCYFLFAIVFVVIFMFINYFSDTFPCLNNAVYQSSKLCTLSQVILSWRMFCYLQAYCCTNITIQCFAWPYSLVFIWTSGAGDALLESHKACIVFYCEIFHVYVYYNSRDSP